MRSLAQSRFGLKSVLVRSVDSTSPSPTMDSSAVFIGVGVGVGLVVIIVIVLVVVFVLRKRKQQANDTVPAQYNMPEQPKQIGANQESDNTRDAASIISNRSLYGELPRSNEPVEPYSTANGSLMSAGSASSDVDPSRSYQAVRNFLLSKI